MAEEQLKQVISKVAKQVGQREEDKVVPMEQLVTFDLDKEEYASTITDLREIIKVTEIVSIPGAPDFIRGILNLRGQIVTVIDLEKRFHLKREFSREPKHIVIAEVEDSVFGVMVDEVTGVLRVPVASIKPTPHLVGSKIHTDYLKGVVILSEADDRETTRKEKQGAKLRKKDNKEEKEEINDKEMKDTEKKTEVEKGGRLLLLLDIPKMLAEKELLEFSSSVQETLAETKVEK
jgi:purine-binding chemotaxis protein CheW